MAGAAWDTDRVGGARAAGFAPSKGSPGGEINRRKKTRVGLVVVALPGVAVASRVVPPTCNTRSCRKSVWDGRRGFPPGQVPRTWKECVLVSVGEEVVRNSEYGCLQRSQAASSTPQNEKHLRRTVHTRTQVWFSSRKGEIQRVSCSHTSLPTSRL